MKFSLPVAVFALSLFSAGDAAKIEIRTTTGPAILPFTDTTYVGDDGKDYDLGDFQDGCRKTKYNWIKQICLDSNKKRGHIVYSGGTKNCFRLTHEWSKLCGGSEGCYAGVCNRCWEWDYTKAKCTW
ncbi:hypothetical protein N0V84_000488 [Fusarium piperis]|uniref:Uncharacterized protein n=1 Tax=Fusarium piperis TaxID=1435070 RepID=A0A9W8WNI5_9HYPO|nr:hypothetical protein N0V84_000488 [Fusarium piperis]